MRVAIAFLCVLLAGGCTYNAMVAPTSAPAAEVLPTRRVAQPVSVYISPELESLTRTARTGFVCSAHTFPVDAGTAVVSTIRSVNDATFSNVIPAQQPRQIMPGAYRHILFELESFTPRLSFNQTFWSVNASGSAEIVLRITVFDQQNAEVLRTLVSGDATSESNVGGCDGGSQALSEAARKAIGRAVENYVYKVINSQQI